MSKKPNILFFFTDDQRFDTINALGNEEIATPNLDALVSEGTAFTQASIMGANSPAVCMPSRAMLMTGRFFSHLQDSGSEIPAEHITLPETLRSTGYHTHHIGKWHQDRDSFHRSFDSAARIFGFADGWYKQYGGHWNVPLHDFDPTGTYDPEEAYILDEDKKTRLPVQTAVGGVHSSEIFADAAIEFLDQRGHGAGRVTEKPFFMYVSFVAPHDPRQSPNKFEEMYSSESVSLPKNFMPRHPFDNGELTIRDEALEAWPRREHSVRGHIADYYAMISDADAQIGRVIEKLKANGEYENTLIIFAGDNGLAVGQHGLMGKQNLYEHSLGVPLIFRGPRIPAGVRTDSLCYLLDIFPTLCEYLEVPTPESVDGTSLLPAMHTPGRQLRDSHYYGYCDCQRALRKEDWKLIEYRVEDRSHTQLFNLKEDPWELNNRAEDPACHEQLASLRRRLSDWRHTSDDNDPGHGQAFWQAGDDKES